MSGILWNLFGKIWIQNVGDIDFLSDFCHCKIQINSKKTRFWKEKSVENVVTLEGLLFNCSIQAWLNFFGGIGMCLWCCWKDLDEQDFVEFIW